MPDICVDKIQESFNCCYGGVVIDGLRNPRDFALLFDPLTDIVVYLTRDNIDFCNDFEKGVEIIVEMTKWNENIFKKYRNQVSLKECLFVVELENNFVPKMKG